jgi:anaerobic nitric oxide reductase flavorubredoxin
MGFPIKKGVTWVGKIDWELRSFHGDELSTHRGSSYNSYLVQDEKTVLIDTVWGPYAKEYVQKLKQVVDLNSIDYIVANHAESDHSGSLPELMKEIPDTPIYCSQNGIQSLKGLYHQDWNFVPVKTGDKLNIGSKELVFVEAKMLHWPDSMFSYLTGDNILFSNDAFGQHLASEEMYADLVDQAELYQEAIKYYANILNPFNRFVEGKINQLLDMKIPVDMICPSHGLIWRENPMQIVEKYLEWARNYQENQISIIYDTMWLGTKRMAEAVGEGIKAENPELVVKLYNAAHSDKSDIITEIFKSKGIMVGSPTINKGILYSIAGMLEMIKGLAFKGKLGAAFGCYGWSGESGGIISEILTEAGFKVISEPLRATWNPDAESLENARTLGKEMAKAIQ